MKVAIAISEFIAGISLCLMVSIEFSQDAPLELVLITYLALFTIFAFGVVTAKALMDPYTSFRKLFAFKYAIVNTVSNNYRYVYLLDRFPLTETFSVMYGEGLAVYDYETQNCRRYLN